MLPERIAPPPVASDWQVGLCWMDIVAHMVESMND